MSLIKKSTLRNVPSFSARWTSTSFEFSKPPHSGLASVYDWYSFNVLLMGRWIADDEASYIFSRISSDAS